MNFRQVKSWQWVLIVIALLVALDWAIRRPDPRTRELNAILERTASPTLSKPFDARTLRALVNRMIARHSSPCPHPGVGSS